MKKKKETTRLMNQLKDNYRKDVKTKLLLLLLVQVIQNVSYCSNINSTWTHYRKILLQVLLVATLRCIWRRRTGGERTRKPAVCLPRLSSYWTRHVTSRTSSTTSCNTWRRNLFRDLRWVGMICQEMMICQYMKKVLVSMLTGQWIQKENLQLILLMLNGKSLLMACWTKLQR